MTSHFVGPLSVVANTPNVSNAMWHRVIWERRKNTMTLKLDGNSTLTLTVTVSSTLDVRKTGYVNVFLGKVLGM